MRVRQALNYAIDRRTIVESLFGTDAIPSSNPNPNSDVDDPSLNTYYDYDPEKARALLAEAGYPDGFTLRVLARGAWIGSFKTLPLMQAMAADLARVGVKLDITSSASREEHVPLQESRRFEAESCIWGTNVTWSWYQLAMLPGGPLTDQHGWTDPVTKKLWEQGSAASPEKAAAIWRQIMRRVVEQAYFVGMLQPGFYTYVNDRVDGVGPIHDAAYGPTLGWFPAQ